MSEGILIVGRCGFIGRALARRLTSDGLIFVSSGGALYGNPRNLRSRSPEGRWRSRTRITSRWT